MMRNRVWAVFLLLGLAGCALPAERTPAEQLVERSIAYHDAAGAWDRSRLDVVWEATRPGGETRVFELELDNLTGRFRMAVEWAGKQLDYACRGDECTARVAGSSDVSAADRERYRLDRDGGAFWRNYFGFLLGQPMKLHDPGTRLDPVVRREVFDGHDVDGVRLSFDPAVGSDVWYLYFDPATAALRGARFYHDEGSNDGEYIVLEGEIEDHGLRLPRARTWYVNADDRLLGTDTVASLAVQVKSQWRPMR